MRYDQQCDDASSGSHLISGLYPQETLVQGDTAEQSPGMPKYEPIKEQVSFGRWPSFADSSWPPPQQRMEHEASNLDAMSGVLIIDDDPTILAIVEGALHTAGHQAVACNNPQQALDLLGANPFDAVVLDVVMPGISGFDVLHTIRSKPHLKTTPVLMLSSRGEAEDRVRGLQQGADDYVVKPFDLDVLIARVERLMARGTLDSSSLRGRLETFSAADLLQNLSQSGKTGLLRIMDDGDESDVYFENGEILRAHQGRLQDAEALVSLVDKDSGTFRFEPGAFKERPPVKPLGLNGILMDAAWLEDEISHRTEFLPPPESLLHFAMPLPTLPPDLEALNLPYTDVGQVLSTQQPMSYAELIRQEIGAPKKVALVVALLNESKVIHFTSHPPTEAQSTSHQAKLSSAAKQPESLAEALDSLRRNQPPEHLEERLHLMVFYGANVWDKLLTLVSTIPRELISADRERLLDQLKIRNSGTLRFKDARAEILVHLHPLETPKKRKDLVFSFVAGVVIWLDQTENLEFLQELANILATRACPVGTVAHRAEFTKGVKESLKNIARLKLTSAEPRDLADLLRTLPLV